VTTQPSYPGYATPTFVVHDDRWIATAHPWSVCVGSVWWHSAGWTATDERGLYVGLFPDKQAAGEALVKHAGYEVL
jgi:hypothetical protein